MALVDATLHMADRKVSLLAGEGPCSEPVVHDHAASQMFCATLGRGSIGTSSSPTRLATDSGIGLSNVAAASEQGGVAKDGMGRRGSEFGAEEDGSFSKDNEVFREVVGVGEHSGGRELRTSVDINGCSRPSSSLLKFKGFSESSENDEVSCSDVESDSGFESGHIFVAGSSSSARSKAVAASKANIEEEKRIEEAILYLDEKVDRHRLCVEALELLKLIPEGYMPLPHQVGGHRHVDGKLGFLRKANHNDILYKPVQAGNKGPREVMFYEGLFDPPEESLPRDFQRLKKLIPGYYGLCDIKDRSGETYQFIKLEDVASRFRKPCILDVKVGRRVWDDFAERDKIERERKKYPPQEILGFRIIGMRVYQSATNDYVYFNKEFGRSVSVSGALEALRVFFLDGAHKRSDAIAAISDRLFEFLDWIQTQASYKLFATSLLIIYEGDSNQPIKSPDQLVDVRWVDFAHAYEVECEEQSELNLDENTLFGLKNLIQFLERLK